MRNPINIYALNNVVENVGPVCIRTELEESMRDYSVIEQIVHCYTMQYNILLLQSQIDRCEADIYKYNSITDRQLPRRTAL